MPSATRNTKTNSGSDGVRAGEAEDVLEQQRAEPERRGERQHHGRDQHQRRDDRAQQQHQDEEHHEQHDRDDQPGCRDDDARSVSSDDRGAAADLGVGARRPRAPRRAPGRRCPWPPGCPARRSSVPCRNARSPLTTGLGRRSSMPSVSANAVRDRVGLVGVARSPRPAGRSRPGSAGRAPPRRPPSRACRRTRPCSAGRSRRAGAARATRPRAPAR